MAITSAIVATVAIVAGTGYQAVESDKARTEAKDMAGKKEQEQAKLIADQKAEQDKVDQAKRDKEAQADALVSATATRNAQQRRRAGVAPANRNNTILTTPLGLPGDNSGQQKKTLLGA